MRLGARTTAYLLSGVAVVAISGGLATTAFAGSTGSPSNIPVSGEPIPSADFPAGYTGPDPAGSPIVRLPDGSVVVSASIITKTGGDHDVKRLPDGSRLVPAGVPVEVTPDGWVKIGNPS